MSPLKPARVAEESERKENFKMRFKKKGKYIIAECVCVCEIDWGGEM